MKPTARLIGFDDGPFTFEDDGAVLVGVMARSSGYVEGVVVGEVGVDGWDATEEVVGLLEGRGWVETAAAIVFDGGVVGGFNVIDLARVHEALGLPAVAVLREPPGEEAVRAALGNVEGGEERFALLTAEPVERVSTGAGSLWVRHVGGRLGALGALLGEHTVQGRTPEALRVAHVVASAVGRARG